MRGRTNVSTVHQGGYGLRNEEENSQGYESKTRKSWIIMEISYLQCDTHVSHGDAF